MKRLLILVLSMSTVFFVSCGNGEAADAETQEQSVQEAQAELQQLCFLEVKPCKHRD